MKSRGPRTRAAECKGYTRGMTAALCSTCATAQRSACLCSATTTWTRSTRCDRSMWTGPRSRCSPARPAAAADARAAATGAGRSRERARTRAPEGVAEQEPAHQREPRATALPAREAERHTAADPPAAGRKNRPRAQYQGAPERRRTHHAMGRSRWPVGCAEPQGSGARRLPGGESASCRRPLAEHVTRCPAHGAQHDEGTNVSRVSASASRR